ncbi:hypothetical protein [Rubrimonas cliftonensis]|nr:hypothetical protein [Rubrimonas cliftonensis]
METWSRAGATGSTHHQPGKARGERRRWTTEEILAEAERLAGAAPHVERGGPPPQIIPGAVGSFAELRAAHAAAAAIKEEFGYTDPKTKTKKKRSRALRKDARTLYTAVFSLPVETKDALADPKLRARCLAVIGDAVAFERDRIEAAGGVLAMSVVHWDEAQVHAHVYAVEPARGRVDALHPGVAAKQALMSDVRAMTLTAKDRNKAGNRAYCEAMRDWQDEIHAEVFAPAGLLRVGPRRERRSRGDYLHDRRAAAERTEDRGRQKALAEGYADLAVATEAVLKIADADREAAAAWEVDLTEREAAIERQRAQTEADMKAAEAVLDAAAQMHAKAVNAQREAAEERACTEAMAAEIADQRAAIERDRADAKRDRASAARDRAATEMYFEITPLALAKGEVKIAEHDEDGARLLPGKRPPGPERRAEIEAAHAAAPKAVRRSLARAWKQVTDAATVAVRAFQPDGLLGKWRGAFEYLKTALMRDQERFGGADDTKKSTPCETAVVALAAAVREDDRALSDDLRRAALAARDRREAPKGEDSGEGRRPDRSRQR